MQSEWAGAGIGESGLQRWRNRQSLLPSCADLSSPSYPPTQHTHALPTQLGTHICPTQVHPTTHPNHSSHPPIHLQVLQSHPPYTHETHTCRYCSPFFWSRLKCSAAAASRPLRCFSSRAMSATLL